MKEPSEKPYNFSVPEAEVSTGGQYGQPWYLDSVIFKEQVKNGFFIEAGADDFMRTSNSLYFEEKYNWTGMLVEPVPTRFKLG